MEPAGVNEFRLAELIQPMQSQFPLFRPREIRYDAALKGTSRYRLDIDAVPSTTRPEIARKRQSSAGDHLRWNTITGKQAFRILVARAYGIRGFADPPYVARFAVAEMNTCKNAIGAVDRRPAAQPAIHHERNVVMEPGYRRIAIHAGAYTSEQPRDGDGLDGIANIGSAFVDEDSRAGDKVQEIGFVILCRGGGHRLISIICELWPVNWGVAEI